MEPKNDDGSTDPLLNNHQDENNDIEKNAQPIIWAEWHKYSVLRNRRGSEKASPIWSPRLFLTTITHRRKSLVVLAALLVILIYVNSTTISWNDDPPAERIIVDQRSHVPGMKEMQTARALKIVNVRSTTIATITDRGSTSSQLSITNNSVKQIPPPGYLVWSDQCKIPNLDPYASDVMKFFKRQKYESCSTIKPLTRVTYDSNQKRYTIHLEKGLTRRYAKFGPVECCYQLVHRSGEDKRADEEFTLDECQSIVDSETVLAPNFDNILVKCFNFDKVVYINAHAMIPERPAIRKHLNEWKKMTPKDSRPLSVLMVGIDSVSRQNFIRAMPKTAKFVYDSEWFEMSGYNKIEDNTFPNLMAIFTGYNLTTANSKCSPFSVGRLDKCPIIWYDFQRHGYVTAYAEDEETISTFNYLKVGFKKPPTDYYLRPLMLAAEDNLHVKRKSSLIFCLGYKHSAEYVYDYILDLATTYKNDTYFGMFWANTFSHNAISDASSMDGRMVQYLEKFQEIGVLDNSMVIFFSDHGMRYGATRQLPSGRTEERLPFFFIWLPHWFKKRHPEFVNALNINKNRLTTPYDVHMTLKHVLELSERASNMPASQDCPKCQSLFTPVPDNRSCADAAIEEHWCTCTPYERIDRESETAIDVANFSVSYINDFLRTYKNGTLTKSCAKLRLSRIKYAYQAELVHGETETYQIAFETKPGEAMFESTVNFDLKSQIFQISGSISRLNSYAAMARCVTEGRLQKFCYCK